MDKTKANKVFESKLSWKRKEALKMAVAIKDFVYDNFEYTLPYSKNQFERVANINEDLSEFYQEYKQLINFYYTIQRSGNSVGHIVEGKNGTFQTQTLAHMYSKHRLEPVWNWRKSNLIRNVYYNYIKDEKLWKHYHPVHIMLSLPHTGGKYKGKEFYAKELIEHFNRVRKLDFWQDSVYAGEYGVEIKESPNGQGLHIHIHSFTLLKRKRNGNFLNEFRTNLRAAWKNLIEIDEETQPIIWVETLYFHKKGKNGQFLTEPKPHSLKQKEIKQILRNKDLTEIEKQTQLKNIKTTVRAKTYLPEEIARIKKLKIDTEEKEKQIVACFTSGVLECIKYHFKMDTFIIDKLGDYNIGLLHEILVNTHRKRLYSRFGKFYKEKKLSLTDNDLSQKEEMEGDNATSKVNENLINPFTGDKIEQENAQFVIFKPENRTYLSPKSINPYSEINLDLNHFFNIESKEIKIIMKSLIHGKFDELIREFENNKSQNKERLRKPIKLEDKSNR